MSRKLEDLDPRFRPLAERLLKEARDSGMELLVVETLRSEEQHKKNVADGRSWARHSKHQDGLAIDVVPLALAHKPGWDSSNPMWLKLGELGETLGLKWGGRFKVLVKGVLVPAGDNVHFEMKEEKK